MRFGLTNFGKVGEANVELNGITVIAGPNGSGKSTISRALFTWSNFLRQFWDEKPRELANIVSEEIESVLEQNNVPTHAVNHLRISYRPPTKLSDRDFWREEDVSHVWWNGRVKLRLSRLAPGMENPFGVDNLYAVVRERVLNRLSMEDVELAKFMVERYFLRAFDGQVGTFFDGHAESKVSLMTAADVCQFCTFVGDKAREVFWDQATLGNVGRSLRMFYLEPRHLLDGLSSNVVSGSRQSNVNRYSVSSEFEWEHVLTKNLDSKDMTFTQKERMTPILEELDKIVSIIHGELDRPEESLVFKDADVPGDHPISLMNIASGAKSIAAIVRGFRNDSIRPGDFLIIDEPESNLHPEWQLSFAKFLVLIHARFGMRILLNTHSPYFLKAIEQYSDMLEQGDDCEYYNMVLRDRGQYETECATGNLQKIFKSMSDPFSRLMQGEHYGRTIS